MIPVAMVGPLLKSLHLLPAALVNGVAPQLVRKWFPVGVDKGSLLQAELRREELQIRRSEIAAAEERFLKGLEAARALKIEEIERSSKLRREDQDYAQQLQRWPLHGILPVNVLRASGARNGRALNVILAVVDTRDAEFYKRPLLGGALINLVLDGFHGSIAQALRTAAAEFHGDVILYHEVTKGARSSGDGLTSSLWSLLRTEPTVLIEVNVPRHSRLTFRVSHWGGAFDPDSPWVSLPPKELDLPGLAFNPADIPKERIDKTITQGLEEAESILSVGLSSLLVSLGDTHKALHRPHEMHAPVLPTFIQRSAQSLSPDALKPMLAAYTASYDGVAAHSPLLASELAARAASASHSAGQPEVAKILLDKSLALKPALRGTVELDAARLAMLRRQRGTRGSLLELEIALKLIRDISVDGQNSRSNNADGQGFEEFMRRFAPIKGQ